MSPVHFLNVLNDKDLTDYLGISHSSMAKWKYDGSNVYLKFIIPICEFLKTTPNYLFHGSGELKIEKLSPVECELIEEYRSLDEGRKRCIRDTLKYFTNAKAVNMVAENETVEKPLL